MIGTKFNMGTVEYTVTERATPRSYTCATAEGTTAVLSTKAINKLLGRTAAAKPAPPLGEDAAMIEIESVLNELDVTAQMRVVRDLAIRYLDEKPSVDEHAPAGSDFIG